MSASVSSPKATCRSVAIFIGETIAVKEEGRKGELGEQKYNLYGASIAFSFVRDLRSISCKQKVISKLNKVLYSSTSPLSLAMPFSNKYFY